MNFPIQPLETGAGFRNHPQQLYFCFMFFMIFQWFSWEIPGIFRGFTDLSPKKTGPQASSHWASALHVLGDVETQRLTPNVILRSAAISACEKVRVRSVEA